MPHRRPPRPTLAVTVSLALAVAAALVSGPTAAAAPAPAKPYDVDGDGFVDLAVGAPYLDVAGEELAGGLAVLKASASGLGSTAQLFTAESPGVAGAPHFEESLGDAVASGDFDGDGYADLAIGRPVAYRPTEAAGAVAVLYGSAKGLTSARWLELLSPGGPQADTGFGQSLVAADFDGDGRSDLAVGWGEYLADGGSGTVVVFAGSASGLAQDRNVVRNAAPTSAGGLDEDFGSALAVGDLDADGRPDLVVSSEREGPDGSTGVVSACYGSSDGVTSCTPLVVDDRLGEGFVLAVGNVSGTARPEVVAGVGRYDDKRGGVVETYSLSGARASTTVSRTELSQASKGVRGSAEKGDEFGSDVVLGDLDRDGYDDLVVGAPGEDADRGRVTVVYGGAEGYRTSGGMIYDQDTKGVPGKAEKRDRFGLSLSLLDHDADGHLDLTVGAPNEDGGDGAVTTVRGSGSAFTTKGARTFTLADLGGKGTDGARFGATLGR